MSTSICQYVDIKHDRLIRHQTIEAGEVEQAFDCFRADRSREGWEAEDIYILCQLRITQQQTGTTSWVDGNGQLRSIKP